jgi:hypothetical protein
VVQQGKLRNLSTIQRREDRTYRVNDSSVLKKISSVEKLLRLFATERKTFWIGSTNKSDSFTSSWIEGNGQDAVKQEIRRRLVVKSKLGKQDQLEYFLRYVTGRMPGSDNRKVWLRKVINYHLQKFEEIDAANATEEKEARLIIKNINEKYGIYISSYAGVLAAEEHYRASNNIQGSLPKQVQNILKTRKWKLKELKALEKALEHFGPILGNKRKDSSRSTSSQEVLTASKLERSIFSSTYLAEYHPGRQDNSGQNVSGQNISFYSGHENFDGDFPAAGVDNSLQLEGTSIHELTHGLLRHELGNYIKTLHYWDGFRLKSGDKNAEPPITPYGEKSAAEDLCEAVMFYFAKPTDIKQPYTSGGKGRPVRAWLIKKMIGRWKGRASGSPKSSR